MLLVAEDRLQVTVTDPLGAKSTFVRRGLAHPFLRN